MRQKKSDEFFRPVIQEVVFDADMRKLHANEYTMRRLAHKHRLRQRGKCVCFINRRMNRIRILILGESGMLYLIHPQYDHGRRVRRNVFLDALNALSDFWQANNRAAKALDSIEVRTSHLEKARISRENKKW